jgi:hypothetical protein
MRYLLAILSVMCASGADASKTERFDFPGGRVLRLVNSTGQVTIEGWSRPEMEITTSASTEGHVTVERRADELVVTTAFPKHRRVDVTYQIRVPQDTCLLVEHNAGEVHIANISSDMHITARQGEISAYLPDGDYAIDARSKFGVVTSNAPGRLKRERWVLGQRFSRDQAAPAHQLFFRIGTGEIMILKTVPLSVTQNLNPS